MAGLQYRLVAYLIYLFRLCEVSLYIYIYGLSKPDYVHCKHMLTYSYNNCNNITRTALQQTITLRQIGC